MVKPWFSWNGYTFLTKQNHVQENTMAVVFRKTKPYQTIWLWLLRCEMGLYDDILYFERELLYAPDRKLITKTPLQPLTFLQRLWSLLLPGSTRFHFITANPSYVASEHRISTVGHSDMKFFGPLTWAFDVGHTVFENRGWKLYLLGWFEKNISKNWLARNGRV